MNDNSIEYVLRIDALTPGDASMLRVGEYLQKFAEFLGEAEHVHFSTLNEGSLKVHARAEFPADPKIAERLAAANEKGSDAWAAQDALNKMLARDNAVGELFRKPPRGELAKVFHFPGRDRPKPREFKVRQQGSIEGFLVSLGGTDASIHGRIDAGEGRFIKCSMTRALAISLAPYLFQTPVRLLGSGMWKRDEDGRWMIDGYFDASSFEVLRDDDFGVVLKNLRETPGAWGDGEDMPEEARRLRHGEDE